MADVADSPPPRGLYVPVSPLETSAAAASDLAFANSKWSAVPWRTIVATVLVVVATGLTFLVIRATARVLTWLAIAGFFAVVLRPVVARVERRVGGRRKVATALVVLSSLFLVLAAAALFIMPVRSQLVAVLTDLPGTVRDAADGRGPVGKLVNGLGIETYVQDHEAELTRTANRLSDSQFQAAQTLVGVVFGFVTVTLMTFLLLSQSVAIGAAVLSAVPFRRREAVKRISADAAGAVSGYVTGNLLISLIAGIAAFTCLTVLRVPNPAVLALWVAFADLLPLVGATIGAAVCVFAAFVQSPTAGIIAAVFFVVYQQVENGVIYPWMMARRVKVSPLVVLLSVLLAAELYGMLGALLAVPASGALQVILAAVRQERQLERLVLPTQ
jgi:predicted PurR-regulated permease PerM